MVVNVTLRGICNYRVDDIHLEKMCKQKYQRNYTCTQCGENRFKVKIVSLWKIDLGCMTNDHYLM